MSDLKEKLVFIVDVMGGGGGETRTDQLLHRFVVQSGVSKFSAHKEETF